MKIKLLFAYLGEGLNADVFCEYKNFEKTPEPDLGVFGLREFLTMIGMNYSNSIRIFWLWGARKRRN